MPPKGKAIRIRETGQILYGVRAVADAISGDHSTVADCLRGERKTHQGYSFEYAQDEEDN